MQYLAVTLGENRADISSIFNKICSVGLESYLDDDFVNHDVNKLYKPELLNFKATDLANLDAGRIVNGFL